MFSRKYKFPFLIFLLTLLIQTSCDGVSEHQVGPEMKVLSYLTGSFRGYRVVRDRNLNVKAILDIKRNCKLITELTGECEDSVLFYGSPEVTHESFQFKLSYDEGLKLHLKIQSDIGFLEGTSYGPGLYLAGKLPVPGMKNKIIPVETRWDRVSIADENLSIQRDMFSYLGFFSGTVETIWQK